MNIIIWRLHKHSHKIFVYVTLRVATVSRRRRRPRIVVVVAFSIYPMRIRAYSCSRIPTKIITSFEKVLTKTILVVVVLVVMSKEREPKTFNEIEIKTVEIRIFLKLNREIFVV